jgi:hypothetical protein
MPDDDRAVVLPDRVQVATGQSQGRDVSERIALLKNLDDYFCRRCRQARLHLGGNGKLGSDVSFLIDAGGICQLTKRVGKVGENETQSDTRSDSRPQGCFERAKSDASTPYLRCIWL